MFSIFFACLFLGTIVGFLAGLLGIGGGLVIVPALVYLLPLVDIAPEHIMPIAIATSLASIVITASSASYIHHRNGNIPWGDTKNIILFVGFGSLAGAIFASSLPADVLRMLFSIFVIAIASYMIASLKVVREEAQPKAFVLRIVGAITGVIASILGIAGGAILVPALTYLGLPMRSSISIATVSGVFVAIFGVIGFIFTGYGLPGLPELSMGYVFLPALLGIVLTSSVFAPIGVKMATKLPVQTLKKAFAFFLILVAIKMMWH